VRVKRETVRRTVIVSRPRISLVPKYSPSVEIRDVLQRTVQYWSSVHSMTATQIERAALSKILATLGVPDDEVGAILGRLRVDRREWSGDVADTQKCVGQFVYFSPTVELPLTAAVTHQGAWASHSAMPGGVDFVLFIKSGVPQFLEIGFLASQR
jgi:hypothetical protein